jgi:DNA polymerase III subunit epsilon
VLTSAGAFQPRGFLDSGDVSAATLAVIDVETTGLDPQTSRVVECAIVRCTGHGQVLDEWSSLIGVPGSDEIGASWLHGITRATLRGAPTFAEVAERIVDKLRGAIVVGHVVAFDLAHLHAEFMRIGARLPALGGATICTRELARDRLFAGSRTLAAVCSRLGVSPIEAHTALGDARATASALAEFVARGVDLSWSEKMDVAGQIAWPNFCPSRGTESAAVPHLRSR